MFFFPALCFLALSYFFKRRLFLISKYANTQNIGDVAFNAMGGFVLISILFAVVAYFYGEQVGGIAQDKYLYPVMISYFTVVWLYHILYCWFISRGLSFKKGFLSNLIFGSILLLIDLALLGLSTLMIATPGI